MTPQDIALVIAGIVAPSFINLLKLIGIKPVDQVGQWFAIIVSYACAYVAIIATGGTVAFTPDGLLAQGAVVTSIALVVYRQLEKTDVVGALGKALGFNEEV